MILREFDEDMNNPDVEVKYMKPEDLCCKNKSVMHDSDDEEDHCCYDGECHDDDDDECCEDHDDKENDMEYVGRDAINTLKADPVNVPVATYEEGSKFYIDYDDIAAYMEAAGIDTIEEALNNVIDCNEESNMDAENIVVVLPENTQDRFDVDYIDSLEESSISFEM